MGINIFGNNLCLLTKVDNPLPEKTQAIMRRGEVFAHLHIAGSQLDSQPQLIQSFIITSFVGDLESFEIRLRNFVTGIRWFWRQKDMKSYAFPLTSIWEMENRFVMEIDASLFKNMRDVSLPLSLLRDAENFVLPGSNFGHRVLPEIIQKASEFHTAEFP